MINRRTTRSVIGACLVLWAIAMFSTAWHPTVSAEEKKWLNFRMEGEMLSKSPQSDISSRGYFQMGVADLLRGGHDELALSEIAKGKAADMEYGESLFAPQVAESLAATGHDAEAIVLWEELIERFPSTRNYYSYANFLARTKKDLRDSVRGVILAQKGFTLVEKMLRRHHVALANILAADGQFKEAIEECKKALKLPESTLEIGVYSDARIQDTIDKFSLGKKPLDLTF